jgi:hypothetical protein
MWPVPGPPVSGPPGYGQPTWGVPQVSGPPGYGQPTSGVPQVSGPAAFRPAVPPVSGAPVFAPPPFPPAVPPVPPSAVRGRLWPFLLGGGALLLVVALVVGLLIGLPRGGGRGGDRISTNSAVAARNDLSDAADLLWSTPGTRYRGTVTDSSGHRLVVDVQVAGEGSVTGTMTTPTGQVDVLSTDGKAFVKGDRAFWQAHGAPDKELDRYATQWVKIGPDLLGFDLAAYLAPQLLAESLAPQDFSDDPGAAVPVTTRVGTQDVNGVPTEVLDSSAGLRVYVTTGQPRRIVRIAVRPQASSGPVPSPSRVTRTAVLTRPGRTAPGPNWQLIDDSGLQLDLADMSAQEVDQFYTELQSRIGALAESVDSEVEFALDGSITLAPCGTSGCQANVTLSNRVASKNQYLEVTEPVHAKVTIQMTLDGRPIQTCTTTITMPPNGKGTATCQATYVIPAERNPTQHEVVAEASAYAEAMVAADVQRMADDLAAEIRRNRQQRPDRNTPAPSAAGSGPTPSRGTGASASPPPCRQPVIGGSDGGPGAWRNVNRRQGPWRRYQEQIARVPSNVEYSVPSPDGGRPTEFEGFEIVDGVPTFTEAKGYGNATWLKEASLDENGKLVIDGANAQNKLDELFNQMNRQLDVVKRTPGARLRFFAAEPAVLDKFKAYAQRRLSADKFSRVDWHQQDGDSRFGGCD